MPNPVNWNLLLEYGVLICVGSFSGLLFALRTLEQKRRSKWQIAHHMFLASGSSMLVAWIAYEIIKAYFHLNYGLSAAISAGVGYLGAEVSGKFILNFVAKKFAEKKR
ncbi:hypothetical protein [Helicobacter heilmannii]|uniref:hypothetical protein n=1 Tax=Helicobacter heilmannii TaxID=35817 RepID=UPI0006A210ED|nr:hypothetical protein [Helicobacter heilmannii]CRF45111.1 hypothetical protein HHE014_00610 [Helicobacter heilmannii]